jgi:hypothetical protein
MEQDNGFSFADPTVQLADCNGDRVPDIAQVRPTGVIVTPGLGYGHFAPAVMMAIPDLTLDGDQVAHAKLTDLNGDGLVDLVVERAAPGECWYWLNLGNYQLSSQKTITGLPLAVGIGAVVRWADLNGNGTTDLIYADREGVPRIQSVDLGELLGGGNAPKTMLAITNGIGRVTLIGYRPSTAFALADAATGQPWTNLMPLSVSLVAAVTNLDSLGHQYLTRFQYHQGYYDPVEKQFRGFGMAEQIDVGDTNAPTLVTRSFFDTGRSYESMKGKLLRVRAELADGKVFTESSTAWTVPPVLLMTGTNGTNVTYVHPTSSRTEVIELGQGAPRTLESEFEYDNFGNPTRKTDYGIVESGDRAAFDDERVTSTVYALNTNLWLLRAPARQEIADDHGAILSRLETYYDDETFSGNNFGQVSLGNLTLSKAWINPSNSTAFVSATRATYDPYGNPITMLDPLAGAAGGTVDFNKGHVREIGYDSRFHTYAASETIHVGNGKPPLVYQAEYDEGYGTVVSSTDFNTNKSAYSYDTFARLTSIVKPYDSATYPTTEYDYALAVPFGASGIVNYVETRQLDKPPGSGGSKRDSYLISRLFSDGLGRALMTKQEAEPAAGSQAPRVVVTGAVSFNARQKPSRTLNPYFSLQPGGSLDELLAYESIEAPGWSGAFHANGQLSSLTLATAHQTVTRYDATLRPVAAVNPDGTFSRMLYEPLITRSYDENDTDPRFTLL